MSYSISVKQPNGFAYYHISHNILVKQPKSYAYYNGTEAWQIDLPKALGLDLPSSNGSIVKAESKIINGNTVRPSVDPGVALPERSQTKQLSNKQLIMLRLPSKFQGKTVSAGVVVRELLLQHYGLDLRNPWASQWLELNAPDVKYAIAISRFTDPNNSGKLRFKVGPNGVVKVQVSPGVDHRLREVSARYIEAKPEPNLFEWVHVWVGRFFSFARFRLL